MSLQAIEIHPETGNPPTGAIVLLHGWGSNARDLASLAPILNLPDYHYLCLDAPLPHPQVPGGKMWYDLESEAHTGLSESRDRLREWFEGLEAKTGLPLEKTLLAGFSQGGAMTLDVGFEYPLAGLVAMSGYLHAEPQLSSPIPPVCVMHGNRDPVVPLSAARSTRDILKQKGVAVQYQEFDMAHEVCPLEIEQLREFAMGAIAS